MKEADRLQRNKVRLQECHPVFRAKVQQVIDRLLQQGFRARIQDGWRSPQRQMEAFNSGNSKLQWGFHNATSPQKTPESLAVDLLDDDAPLSPSTPYLLALAAAAEQVALRTGILWGLPADLKAATEKAIAARELGAKVKVGWDPTHLEITGISVAAARAGKRPTAEPVAPKVAAAKAMKAPAPAAAGCGQTWTLTWSSGMTLQLKVTPANANSEVGIRLTQLDLGGGGQTAIGFSGAELAKGVRVPLANNQVTRWFLGLVPLSGTSAKATTSIEVANLVDSEEECSSTGTTPAGHWTITT